MADLFHEYGSDLQLNATGGLRTVDGTELGQQRIIRRLMTNQGEYVWDPGYGAGVRAYIGTPTPGQRIEANVRKEMRKEAAVEQSPPPSVRVDQYSDGTNVANIIYRDATTGNTSELGVPVRTQ